MQYSKHGNNFVLKLEMGESMIDSLKNLCKKENIASGFVNSGIGAFSQTEIGYLKGNEHVKMIFEKRMEINSISGPVSNGPAGVHIHFSGSDEEYHVHGGHLFSATANPMAEIFITKFQ
ncbi:MAG: DNA-binding protein [Candidatus Thermoplasmatota archaeon]|jgi:predicted DNA-binding protein with PD1-like motif|nr:DNA-binding protein [Candidatus Thermoplasmatota archaeon]MCL5987758.1 DNA-binding protein [Candidatus Thermoplasmatota archaeon]